MGFNRALRKEFKKQGIVTADVQKLWEDDWRRLLREDSWEELKQQIKEKKEIALNPPPPTIDRAEASAYIKKLSGMDGKDIELPDASAALLADEKLVDLMWDFNVSPSMRGREYALGDIIEYLEKYVMARNSKGELI